MRCVLSLVLVGLLTPPTIGGEIKVNWIASGGSLVSSNKLPQGAKVKIRVKYLDTARVMVVNGQRFGIKNRDDNFRSTVGNDGKISISISPLKPVGRQLSGELYFQKKGTTGTGLIVVVED